MSNALWCLAFGHVWSQRPGVGNGWYCHECSPDHPTHRGMFNTMLQHLPIPELVNETLHNLPPEIDCMVHQIHLSQLSSYDV